MEISISLKAINDDYELLRRDGYCNRDRYNDKYWTPAFWNKYACLDSVPQSLRTAVKQQIKNYITGILRKTRHETISYKNGEWHADGTTVTDWVPGQPEKEMVYMSTMTENTVLREKLAWYVDHIQGLQGEIQALKGEQARSQAREREYERREISYQQEIAQLKQEICLSLISQDVALLMLT